MDEIGWNHRKKSLNPMHGKWPFSGGDFFQPWDFSATPGQRHGILNFGGDFGLFPGLEFFRVENGHFPGGIRPGKWAFSRLEFAVENGHFPGWDLCTCVK